MFGIIEMERRTSTPSEKAKSIDLFKAHQKALRRGGDLSWPHHLPTGADEAEEELDRYLLNETRDDLHFNVEKDGTRDVDGIYQWWNALHNDIKKYGTADAVKKQNLIKRQRELENKQRDVQSAESHIKYLFNYLRTNFSFLFTTFLSESLDESIISTHHFNRHYTTDVEAANHHSSEHPRW